MTQYSLAALPALALLASCGSPNDPGPGGVTRGEAQTLNDAAQMLDNAAAPPAHPASEAPKPAPLAANAAAGN